jgi:hypothetical protein
MDDGFTRRIATLYASAIDSVEHAQRYFKMAADAVAQVPCTPPQERRTITDIFYYASEALPVIQGAATAWAEMVEALEALHLANNQ